MPRIRGKIERVAQNDPSRFGLMIGGNWYNAFGTCPYQQGQEVDLEYEDKGTFHNLKTPKQAPAQSAIPQKIPPMPKNDVQTKRIARSVAWKCVTGFAKWQVWEFEGMRKCAREIEEDILSA